MAIIGSRAGKSTMRTICGLMHPHQGRSSSGEDISHLGLETILKNQLYPGSPRLFRGSPSSKTSSLGPSQMDRSVVEERLEEVSPSSRNSRIASIKQRKLSGETGCAPSHGAHVGPKLLMLDELSRGLCPASWRRSSRP